MDAATVQNLRHQYGLDRPPYVRYLTWIGGFPRGDFGYSLDWKRPVTDLIHEPAWHYVILSLISLAIMWIVAIPIGIYSATHQYSLGDNGLTLLGFLGLSVPDFLLVWCTWRGHLRLQRVRHRPVLHRDGEAPWSPQKIMDLAMHCLASPHPGRGRHGPADPHHARQPARDPGRSSISPRRGPRASRERVVINKYAVRVAINPLISVMGMQLPQLISGATVSGYRAVAADDRPVVLPCPAQPGHVPGRLAAALLWPHVDDGQPAGRRCSGLG